MVAVGVGVEVGEDPVDVFGGFVGDSDDCFFCFLRREGLEMYGLGDAGEVVVVGCGAGDTLKPPRSASLKNPLCVQTTLRCAGKVTASGPSPTMIEKSEYSSLRKRLEHAVLMFWETSGRMAYSEAEVLDQGTGESGGVIVVSTGRPFEL